MLSKRLRGISFTGAAILCLSVATAPFAQDKPNCRDGRKVFEKCKACHTFELGNHRFGPSLRGFFGRQAGTAEDFPYSYCLREKGEARLIWTDDALDTFLTAPKRIILATKMTFSGHKDAKKWRDVIAYGKRRALQ